MRVVPSEQFPPGLSDVLGPELARVGEEIIDAIAAEVPAYARPLEGDFGDGVRRGVDEALRRFLLIIDDGPDYAPDLSTSRDVYVRLGRGEFRAGRSLDNLLSAYRVGAKVSWRRLAEVATARGGLDADGLVSLAETVFAYIDGICAASAEGYALAQSAAAGEQERLRDRLGELLVFGADAETVERTARAASVRLPTRLTAVLVPGCVGRPLAPRLPPDSPRTTEGDDVWVFVDDTGYPARRPRLAGELAGLGAVIGPAVPLADAALSAERARFARDARAAGRLPAAAADDPLFTDDHLGALLLARDSGLLADLARRRLAPLVGLPPRTRDRLAETLLHWLALRGQRRLVADRLHVHPQTVRYRVNQLRALFGPVLEDPDARFELELVLRAGPACWAAPAGQPPVRAGATAGSRSEPAPKPRAGR
jgi:hypothetical protein